MFVLVPLLISAATLALYVWNPAISVADAEILAAPAMVVPGLLAIAHISLSLRIQQCIEAGLGLMYALASVALFTGIGSISALLLPAAALLLLAGVVAQTVNRSSAEFVWFGILGGAAVAVTVITIFEPAWAATSTIHDPSLFKLPVTPADAFIYGYFLIAVAVLVMPPARIRPVRITHVCAMPVFFALLHHDLIIDELRFPFVPEASMTAVFIILLIGVSQLYWRHAFIDELTGISNRRSLEERLKTLGRSFSIAMIDIDHFKSFNDTHGHAEGDNVLRWVAGILMRTATSKVYRYGGEEFCVVYGGLSKKAAAENAERIRAGIEEGKFHIRAHQSGAKRSGSRKERGKSRRARSVSVTISCGVAESSREERDAHAVIAAADRALYKAKADGRNRVCVAARRRNRKK